MWTQRDSKKKQRRVFMMVLCRWISNSVSSPTFWRSSIFLCSCENSVELPWILFVFSQNKIFNGPSLALITCSYNISNPSHEYVCTKYLATFIYVSRLLSNLIDIITTFLSRYSVNRNSKMFYITRTTWTLNCSITSRCISETRSRMCTGNCTGFRNTVGGYRYSGQR